MSERAYRFILGIVLMIILYLDVPLFYYGYVAVLLLEGITPWRIPMLASRWRFGVTGEPSDGEQQQTICASFEAERAMRLTFGVIMVLTFFVLPAPYWFLNWVISVFLLLSGMVNVCPLVLLYRAMGMR